MRKHLSYISAFFLALSVSFVLPKAVWHDCSSHSHTEFDVQVDGGEEGISVGDYPCLICDFEFPPISFSARRILETPIFFHQQFHSFPYHAPALILAEAIYLRGPPNRFEA